MQHVRVLIIEEELIISEYLSVSLREKSYEVIGTPRTVDEAVDNFGDSRPDLVILDIQMGGRDEMIQAASMIRKTVQMDIPIVFLTTIFVDPFQTQLSDLCVKKPFSERELHAAIESVVSNPRGACRET